MLPTSYDVVVAALETALKSPQAGAVAHQRMIPRPPRGWPAGFDPESVRHAAGLLLIVPIADRAHVVLTVRAGHLLRHRGQVALPGGGVDPGETFEAAAEREAHEEIGLPRGTARILGRLSPVDIFVSGFRLQPIVGCVSPRPELHPAAAEVDRIVDVPLDALAGPSAVGQRSSVRDGMPVEIPFFSVDGLEIWGATAMILSELLSALGHDVPSPRVQGSVPGDSLL